MKRNRNLWRIAVLLALAAMLLTLISCGDTKSSDDAAKVSLSDEVKKVWDEKYDYGTLSVGKEGATLSNAFFDWKINGVDTKSSLNGKKAADGKTFLIVNISVTNTEDYAYETGNYEFLCITGPEEGDEIETQDSFYDDMIPDSVELEAGDTLTGDLVFEINETIKAVLIDYEEFWADGSTGNTNWFELQL